MEGKWDGTVKSERVTQTERDGRIQWAEQIFVTVQSLVLETQFPLLRLNKTFLRVFTGLIYTLKTSYFLYFHVQELKNDRSLVPVGGWVTHTEVGHTANSSLLTWDWGNVSDDLGEGEQTSRTRTFANIKQMLRFHYRRGDTRVSDCSRFTRSFWFEYSCYAV